MPNFVDHKKRLLSRLLEGGRHHYRPTELFGWMVEDILADLTGRPHSIPDQALDTVARLSGEYARAVAQAAPFTDLLGPLYMDVGANDKGFAQFFTPSNVSDAMALMNLPATPPRSILRVMEPCAGAGGMLLAMCRAELWRGKEGLEQYSLTAVDLDPLCARMTAVQLLANLLIHQIELAELFVYSGNSLLLSPESWVLVAGFSFDQSDQAWPEAERRQAAARAVQAHPANAVSVLSY